MMEKPIMLALILFVFIPVASAQQPQRRATPTLTSEDLLDRPSPYGSPATSAQRSRAAISSSSLTGGLYRDPAGAFSLKLPSTSWSAKAQGKGQHSDLRVFRKLDADGFASATASVYVLPSTSGLPVGVAAVLDAKGRQALAQSLAARFLSNSAAVLSAEDVDARSGFQVLADQMVSGRAVVRALISAFEREGKIYVVVCRAPLEGFDAQAPEFSAITQSLAQSIARSS